MKRTAIALVAAITTALALNACTGASPQSGEHWVGTWMAAVVPMWAESAETDPPFSPPAAQVAPPAESFHLDHQTLRQIVRTSIGGRQTRVEFTNRYGTVPLEIGAAHVALRDKDAQILPGSGHHLTFGGRAEIAIPPGAVAVSDPVDLEVPPLTDLAIDLYLPVETSASPSPVTMHRVAVQTNYVSAPGNHAGAPALPVAATNQSWYFLSRVDVAAPMSTGAVVTFGDSITDGTRSTPDTNNRWPNRLAKRLADSQHALAVLNAGISGNRVLSQAVPALGINALARLDYDVFAQPGVKFVFVLEGINDIGMARENPWPTANDIIIGHRQLIARARGLGLRIFASTLLPYEGAAYWTEDGEKKRQAVNEWLRTTHPYDALVDLDAVLRDPDQPTRLRARFDSGDKLHPNDEGYAAMADAIDLDLFQD